MRFASAGSGSSIQSSIGSPADCDWIFTRYMRQSGVSIASIPGLIIANRPQTFSDGELEEKEESSNVCPFLRYSRRDPMALEQRGEYWPPTTVNSIDLRQLFNLVHVNVKVDLNCAQTLPCISGK